MLSKWGKKTLAGVMSAAVVMSTVPATATVSYASEQETEIDNEATDDDVVSERDEVEETQKSEVQENLPDEATDVEEENGEESKTDEKVDETEDSKIEESEETKDKEALDNEADKKEAEEKEAKEKEAEKKLKEKKLLKEKKEDKEDEEVKEVKELLHFTMDNLEDGVKSGNYTAEVKGSNISAVKDSTYGKSIEFGGGSYLSVKDSNGKSPLNGLDEVTINYYSKGSGSGQGWTVFAVRNDEKPSYQSSEHYLGILDKATSIKVERHKCDGGSRPEANNVSTKSGWKMVTVVVSKGETNLYVDGAKVSSVKSDNLLSDILQDNSAFYIGKANWENGEYFQGNIDEMTIYSGAMTDEQVSEKYSRDKENFTVVSDEDECKLAADEITLANTQNIKGNITLPTKNSYGAKVEWVSSRPEIISDKEVAVAGYDNMPAGVVTRTDKIEEVTLTATITLGDKVETKTFDVTVAPKAQQKKLEKYLFAFFPSNSEEQLYFATGTDHLHFTDVNDGEPVLTSKIGDQGIRDPYLLRSAEGDHFYLIATDLKVQNTGWSTAQYGGSLRMLVWESDDLVNWSEARLVDVGMDEDDFTQLGNVGCLWAPEAIYDEKTGEYVVFWASMSKDQRYQVTYYSKTRDFVNFTTAKKYIDRGNLQHCIDTSMVKGNDGKYYRISADTNANGGSVSELILESSDSVLGEWTRLSNMREIQKGMKNYDKYKKDINVDFVGGKVEGPELIKLNDGKTFGLYMDNYGGIGYIPTTTTDLSDTSGASWTVYTSDQYDFGSLKKRHGGILGITQEEYDAVMAKWGNTVTDPTIEEEESENPILTYDFEKTEDGKIVDASSNGNTGKLHGNATVVSDEERGQVLYLDGNSSYAEFPEGFFDGRNKCTISFDMKSDTVSGNFFNFAIGKDNNKYYYLRARDTSTYMGITKSSWSAESGVTASTKSIKDKWNHYTVVFNNDEMYIYLNGELAGTTKIATKVSDLGKNLIGYLGKSFYSADAYVKGYYDNVQVYNRVLSEKEIAKSCGVELEMLKKVTSDDVTFITQSLNKDTNEYVCYVSKNNTNGDITAAGLNFELLDGAEIVEGQQERYDLTKPVTIKVKEDGVEKVYTLKFELCNNPLLGGQFADPDIDCFNGKYYIYPTTDGVSGWGGYQFHVFSSDNLVDWKDEGIIVDLKQDNDAEVVNEAGVKIAAVPWSDGNAWAPSIEEKNGKYYFYFCGNDVSTNSKAIGVAYADNPAGPFTVLDKPLVTVNMCKEAGVSMGQAIDPSVFTDKDGTSYLSFGNGKAAIVKLNDDMISIDQSTMQNVGGLNNFRESLIITYRNGMYHYTWSCDDTGSENYSVAYGTSDKLGGRVNYRGMLLQKEVDNDILGTGHHSILNIPGTDDWYICYHRFMTPLGQVSSGFGYHREVCLDKLTFDEDGFMQKVTPTNAGINTPVYVKGYEPKEEPKENPEEKPAEKPSGKKPSGGSSGAGSSSGSNSESASSGSTSSGSTSSARPSAPAPKAAVNPASTQIIADAQVPLAGQKAAEVTNKVAKKTVKKVAENTKVSTTEEENEETEVTEEKVSEPLEDTVVDESVEPEVTEDTTIEEEQTPTTAEKETSLPRGILAVIIFIALTAIATFGTIFRKMGKNK